MSTAPYLQLISEVLPVQRRDFYLEDATLLNPLNANPILDGEFLQISANYKLERGSGTQATPAFQVFAERGRYDTQAIGKTVVLYIGGYEAETSVCDTGSLGIGDSLVVVDVTVGVAGKRGLQKVSGTPGPYRVFGYVTRLPGGGKVRYLVPFAGGTYRTI